MSTHNIFSQKNKKNNYQDTRVLHGIKEVFSIAIHMLFVGLIQLYIVYGKCP